MSDSSVQSQLCSDLLPREAIIDALYRAETAFDSNDKALFETSVTDDMVFTMNGGTVSFGKDALWGFISSKDTTHFASNIRVMYASGSDTAKMTFTGLAQHYGGGTGNDLKAPYFLAGGLNKVDLVKGSVEGVEVWKIKHWAMDRIWAQGDQGVLH
ncbi:hypothetical protein BD324DRAFT_205619 [Kockovaella imperatae]|uniref:SnoaL-like domain-containing protein n=1 Tax=Kockovaella imperatae TaxID=4999 RepID=A0A1Y1U8N8_9TREE|nr:hypothetical protein BD324DRAFT_205619 [Kockovaella imperatae]ORX33847.1 hypothetical protein BD324DRAFT_205619 [Kockovaella imperatae]